MKLFIQVCLTITLLMFLGISAKAGNGGGMETPGACCIVDDSNSCEFTISQTCALTFEGEFLGEGTSCEPNPCIAGPITIIPTMSQWGIIFTSLILAITAVFMLRRRSEQ